MRARRRIVRVGKWLGLAMFVAILCLDVLTTWGQTYYAWAGTAVGFGSGSAFVNRLDMTPLSSPIYTPGWHAYPWLRSPERRWWFAYEFSPGFSYLRVPLWLIWLPLAGVTRWLWYRDRRDKGPGHCAACGYDLRGLKAREGAAGVVCPECGKS